MTKHKQNQEVQEVNNPNETRSEGNLEPQFQEGDTVDTKKQDVEQAKADNVLYGSSDYPGRKGVIDANAIVGAEEIRRDYRTAKSLLEAKIIGNEEWFRLRHWDTIAPVEGKEEQAEPASAWLFNSLANKHADFMDNIPAPNFLPREESDQADADMLQKIIPCVLDANGWEQTYSDASWYKLKQGTSCYGVFWNSDKENGLGDVDIKTIDLKNLYWAPNIKNIQSSPHLFFPTRVNAEALISSFPFLDGKIQGSPDGDMVYYAQDENDVDRNVKDNENVTVVDWYYKKTNSNGKMCVHYVKYVGDQVIYASENDDRYKDSGYYDHGKYPFAFDVMFPIESGPVGFGALDIMKSPQIYIDKLDQIVLNNAAMSGRKRWFTKKSSNVNTKDYADWSKDFVEVESGNLDDNLKEIQVSPVPSFIVNHLQLKVDELKETSGNRDFSQGSTSSGVTAASAIAALQEAGSKLSRDMIKASYRSFCEVCTMTMELIRQFYTEERSFRIDKPEGGYQFVQYSNATITDHVQTDPVTGEQLSRRPVFDIKISAQKQSPFNRTAQNEMAKGLFQLGCFNPQLATQVMPMLQMMDFEGIDNVKKTVSQNGTLIQEVQQLQQITLQMAQQLDQMSGGQMQLTQQVAGIIQQATGQQVQLPQSNGIQGNGDTDNNGVPATDNTQATKARLQAAKSTNPNK